MNILLVYPEYPDTFWSFKPILKFISKKAAFPPLGLLTIASMLPKEWNIRLIDMNVRKLKEKDIKWADMVFISSMIVQKNSALEVIELCRKHGRKVVMGGPAPTTQSDDFSGADHFVLNEAEVTLPMFLEDLKNGNLKKTYASQERPDISKTPLPMWSLIKFKDYATMPLQYSRGCPFNCEFCDIIIMNGRVPRTKTSGQMISEFQALYGAGWRGEVFIVDDNFIGNKVNAKTMLAELIKWQKKRGYPFRFMTEASVNLAGDMNLMRLMSAANFHKVFLGIETPEEESLKECGKLHNAAIDLAEAVKTIHRNGMQVMGGFIVGFDNDTEKIFKAQWSFIQKVGVVTAMVGLLNAAPQTRLWHRLKAEGRLVEQTTGENTDGSLNFKPMMGRKKLVDGYKNLMSRIYSPKQYYRRIETFINDYNPKAKSRIKFNDVKALIRSMWRIGIFSRARFHYWKLLIKTGIRKRKAFPTAVELAILGLHFSKVSKRIRKA